MKLSEKYERMAELARAQEAGKQLQAFDGKVWYDTVMHNVAPEGVEYWRIKPVPRECWMVLRDNGVLDAFRTTPPTSKAVAKPAAWTHMREVIDE